MEEQKKKKWGIYKLVSGAEIVSNPIYTGPVRKDLVLDIDQHNKVITKLLTKPKGEPASPAPEKLRHIPWLKPKNSDKKWMDLKTLRVLQTFLIYAGYFMLAVMLLLYSSTVRDVGEVTGREASPGARHLFTGVSVGAAVVGALTASFLVKRTNKWFLLSTAMFLLATSSLILPFCMDATIMTIALGLMGLSMGLFEAGGNLSLLRIWGAEHESWLQALHFFYALGLFIAHWLLEPFFKQEFHPDFPPHPVTYKDLPNKEYLFVIGEVDVSKSQEKINVEVQGELVRSHEAFKNERIANIGSAHRVQSANFAVDNEFVLASIPTFLIAFGFLILAFYTFLRKRMESAMVSSDEVKKLRETECQIEDVQKVPGFVLVFLSFLVLCFFASISWLQISVGEYLFGFSFHALNFSANHAKILTLVYWGSIVIGTFFGIFIIKVLKAKTFTSISIAILALTVLPWCFIARCHALAWLVATLVGFSSSVIFATVVSWAFENFRIDGCLGAVITVARTTGLMLGSTTAALVLKHYSFQSFLPITAGIVTSLTLLFILMHFTANKYGANKVSKIVVEAKPEGLDDVDDGPTGWLHDVSPRR